MIRQVIRLFTAIASCFILCSANHTGPKYDSEPRDALDILAISLAKKYQLNFLNSGTGIIAGYDEGLWALNYTSAKKMTIEEARPMVAEMAQAFLYKMYHDPLFAAYMEASKRYSRRTELANDLMGFKIAFWDENVDRPLNPYLAQIRFADNKIYFHYASPKDQSLLEPKVETLEEIGLTQDRYR